MPRKPTAAKSGIKTTPRAVTPQVEPRATYSQVGGLNLDEATMVRAALEHYFQSGKINAGNAEVYGALRRRLG